MTYVLFDASPFRAIIFPTWKYTKMKTSNSEQLPSPLTHEFRQIWDDIMSLQPHLRAILPADLARARVRLQESDARSVEAQPFPDHHILIFYRVAILLERHAGTMTMRELGEDLDIPLSTATRTVDWLVKSAYVERLSDPQDRRIVRVGLTAAGKELYAAIDEFINQQIQKFLRHFSPQERREMLALIRKAIEVLRTFPV